MGNLKKVFENVYTTKKWGSKSNTPFYSGIGSYDKNIVDHYVNVIKHFTEKFQKKFNVIDIGCGDFNVGKKLLPYFNNYIGVDVVESLIKYNRSKFKNLNVNFEVLDITNQSISFTDVIILRQVLQHLSNQDIISTLKNIYLKSKYIIFTDSLPINSFTPNLDIESGGKTRIGKNSGVDITSQPFNFSFQEKQDLLTINETWNFKDKQYRYLTKTIIYKQYE